MPSFLKDLQLLDLVTSTQLAGFIRAFIVLVAGLVLTRIAARALGRVLETRVGNQQARTLERLLRFGLIGLVLATTAHQLGFNLGVLLGAAGVLTVALGFASQTSASNLISGLFLIAERPFLVGDVIRMDTLTGEVLSIDLLSTKLRTFDNLFVRVPNEQIIKSNVTNLTRFPIRRVDVLVGVAYRENLPRVEELLREIAKRNPLAMDDPQPLLIFQGFGDSSLNYQFSIWGRREKFLELKNSIQREIKEVFDREGIEIPFPHRTLYTGSITDPFPVRLVSEVPAASPEGPEPIDPAGTAGPTGAVDVRASQQEDGA